MIEEKGEADTVSTAFRETYHPVEINQKPGYNATINVCADEARAKT